MNRYVIIDTDGDVISIDADELCIDSFCAEFAELENNTNGYVNRNTIAIYPLANVKSITKQKVFTEKEILSQINDDDLRQKINEIQEEEFNQQIIAAKESGNEPS